MPYDEQCHAACKRKNATKSTTDGAHTATINSENYRSHGVASPQTGSYGTASSASHITLCQWFTTEKNVGPWRELAARPASASSEERQQMPAFGAFRGPVCVAHF